MANGIRGAGQALPLKPHPLGGRTRPSPTPPRRTLMAWYLELQCALRVVGISWRRIGRGLSFQWVYSLRVGGFFVDHKGHAAACPDQGFQSPNDSFCTAPHSGGFGTSPIMPEKKGTF
jgi:hypothetical protein